MNIDGSKGPVCEDCRGGGRVAYGPWGVRPPKKTCERCGGSGIEPVSLISEGVSLA
jgi:DnaJ-class molecular chaperone